MTAHVQTKREIQETLAAAGLHPRKRFGQHFLIDGNLMRRLVQSAELGPGDLVLEVGPGTGGLTDLLVGEARHVVCVEIDHRLITLLEDRFRHAENLTLITGDILQSKHRILSEVEKAIRGFVASRDGSVKLVANLPYQAATPLVMNLLVDFPQVRRLCFTVQAEVGERITSKPNCKAYGPLSVLAQTTCTIEVIARIGPRCFWPAPAVDSIMLRMDVRDDSRIAHSELPAFAAFVRSVFEHRRKQLRTVLKNVLDGEIMSRLPVGFDDTRRPEQVSIDEWVTIFRALS